MLGAERELAADRLVATAAPVVARPGGAVGIVALEEGHPEADVTARRAMEGYAIPVWGGVAATEGLMALVSAALPIVEAV